MIRVDEDALDRIHRIRFAAIAFVDRPAHHLQGSRRRPIEMAIADRRPQHRCGSILHHMVGQGGAAVGNDQVEPFVLGQQLAHGQAVAGAQGHQAIGGQPHRL